MEPRRLSGPVTISLAAILLVMALLATYTATAIPAGWSGDVQLTNTEARDEVPHIAIDGSGSIHIIYAGEGVPYYAKLSPDGSLALTKRLTDRSPAAFESGIAVDPLGNIHLVWRDKTTRYNIVYKRLNPSGSIAVDETQATFGGGDMPSLAVDPNGNPSIVYSLPTAGAPGSGVGYTKLDTIGKTVISQKVITNTFYENWGPAAAVDPLGNAHIAWSDLRNGTYAIYYSRLDLNGRILINESKVSAGGGQSTNPLDMALDFQMNIYIAWVDDRDGNWEVYYAKLSPTGAVLRGDTSLTNDSAASWKPGIAVGPDDSLHIVWEDERDGNKELYYKRLDSNGTVLVDETRLTYNLAASQNPDIAVDPAGVVHIVWEQDGEIYYKKSIP